MEEVLKEARISIIQKYGKEGLPAGPGIQDEDNLIIVEGRADVVNLLKHGFRNVIAVQGTNIPPDVVELTKKKVTTAFLDGDHGGDLILRELIHLADLDYVARAPHNHEVEELSSKEILKALRAKIPIEQIMKEMNITTEEISSEEGDLDESDLISNEIPIIVKSKKEKSSVEQIPATYVEFVENISEQEAILLGKDLNILKEKIPISELRNMILETNEVEAVIFDGIITQRLLDIAYERGVKTLVGARQHDITKKPANIDIYTFSE